MKVIVRFLAVHRRLAGASSAEFELADGATLARLIPLLVSRYPALAAAASQSMYLIGARQATRDTVLQAGDEIILAQILGGG